MDSTNHDTACQSPDKQLCIHDEFNLFGAANDVPPIKFGMRKHKVASKILIDQLEAALNLPLKLTAELPVNQRERSGLGSSELGGVGRASRCQHWLRAPACGRAPGTIKVEGKEL